MSSSTRSWCWDYFDTHKGQRGGKCKACGEAYSNGMLVRMKKHLLKCTKLSKVQKQEVKVRIARDEQTNERERSIRASSSASGMSSLAQTFQVESQAVPIHRQANITKFVNHITPHSVTKAHRALTRAFITGNVPLSFAQNDEFAEFLRLIAPAYTPPDRYHGLTQVYIPEEYNDMRRIVEEAITSAEFLSFSTDGWKDNNNRFFLNLLAHTPTPWLYSFEDVTEQSETGEKIYEYVKAAALELGPEKLAGFVTDHASAMLKSWRLLKHDYPWLQATGCKGHAQNLLAKDIVEHPHFKEFRQHCAHIFTFFSSKIHGAILMESFRLAGKKLMKLVKPGSTRWNTWHDAAKRMIDMKAVLESALYSPKLPAKQVQSLRDAVCNDTFWSNAKSFERILKPIADTTIVVQSDSAPAPQCYNAVSKALEDTTKAIQASELPVEVKRDLQRFVEAREDFMDTALPFLHQLLDPYSRGRTLNGIQKMRARHLLRTEVSQNPKIGSTAVVELQLWEGNLRPWEQNVYGTNGEAWKALDDKVLDAKSWWAIYFPDSVLGKVVKFINSIPISSAACERTWSIRGTIQTKSRNRLLTSTTDQINYVKYNLCLLKQRARPKKSKKPKPDSDNGEAAEGTTSTDDAVEGIGAGEDDAIEDTSDVDDDIVVIDDIDDDIVVIDFDEEDENEVQVLP